MRIVIYAGTIQIESITFTLTCQKKKPFRKEQSPETLQRLNTALNLIDDSQTLDARRGCADGSCVHIREYAHTLLNINLAINLGSRCQTGRYAGMASSSCGGFQAVSDANSAHVYAKLW